MTKEQEIHEMVQKKTLAELAKLVEVRADLFLEAKTIARSCRSKVRLAEEQEESAVALLDIAKLALVQKIEALK